MANSSSTDSHLTYLNSYCERAGSAEFWAEPFNAITNVAFILAAYYSAKALAALGKPRRNTVDIWALVFLLAGIGIGSFLWHTAASPTTVLMDVIPILLFMNLYIIALLWRIFQLKWCHILLVWCCYFGASLLGEKLLPPDMLNGSVLYLPTYITLVLFTLAAWRFQPHAFPALFTATVIFTLSLVFRTVDIASCASLPIGTHFLWHCLNAVLLYRLMQLLIQQASMAQKSH